MLKYKTKVKIISGFYEGVEGEVIRIGDYTAGLRNGCLVKLDSYYVKFDDLVERFIETEFVELDDKLTSDNK